jgi:hypothetical protein
MQKIYKKGLSNIILQRQRYYYIFGLCIDNATYSLTIKKDAMNFIKRDAISPDKYDIFIQRIDSFQSLVEEKKRLQAEISQIQTEYMEKIRPLEDEFATVIKKLETNLAKLEGTSASPAPSTIQKFSRGQLGVAIKELLRTNADRNFKPREIAEALDTKGTTVSVWFNKYGVGDSEIERIPSGKDGKRYVYRIK